MGRTKRPGSASTPTAPSRSSTARRLWDRLTDDQIISEALRRCQDESATWLPADLARHVATLLDPTDPHATATVERIDRLAHLAAARCVDLAPETPRHERTRRDGRPVTEAVTDRRITTTHVLDQETDLQRWAQANIGRHPIDHTDPHGDAARAMAAGRRLVLVVGPAGTGKTTTTARAVDSLRSQGRPVVALAPSGKAADVLGREAGCPAETLAAFLTRHGRDPSGSSRWPAGTTVVVDEAGMATTDDLHHLVTLAERHGWRVIAIGDPAQLPAVGRGGMFAHWTDTLPAHHLDQPRRFTEPWEAAASLALRAGDPAAATAYDTHDRLSPVHPALTAARAANLYREHAVRGPDGRHHDHHHRHRPPHQRRDPTPEPRPRRRPRGRVGRRDPRRGRRPHRHPPQPGRPPHRHRPSRSATATPGPSPPPAPTAP